ncbi:unnamed protein product [Paramecium primaurelia]|uniref:Uncharacterized protein n=1 Tax=Paramecium primaurelia TaxID=5886 RepID=A0A8S1QQI9_PARPR|nr:unnamed protein product [Paramecium primaurelia]
MDDPEDLSEIFAQVQGVDKRIYSLIIQMQEKQNTRDWMGFLSDYENLRHLEENNIKLILNVIVKIKDHDFNKQDYSDQRYLEQRQDLIKCIREQKQIIRFLKFLAPLRAYDENLIQCGSNSLKFIKIKILKTSELRIFLYSELIFQVQLKRVITRQCRHKWNEFKGIFIAQLGEINKLDGHTDSVYSVCLSPDGIILTSGSNKKIFLWDLKTGQFTLASGSNNTTIRLWDVKTGQQKIKLDGHRNSVNSHLTILYQHMVVVITLSVFGMENQEKKFNLRIKIIKIFIIILRLLLQKTLLIQVLIQTFLGTTNLNIQMISQQAIFKHRTLQS